MTFAGLQAALAGEVVAAASPGYETARRAANARFHDTRPAAVAFCHGDGDVAEALRFARGSGLAVAIRSGGHCFAGRSTTTGVVVDVSRMHDVAVSGHVAVVGAGTRLGALYDALEPHGVTLPLGCGPAVGIAGLTLGGGLGLLGRTHGLTCDRLVAARVVLASGEIVACDEERHADLFWALRGAGGGQFGVVTSLVFATVPAPAATLFSLAWPGRVAGEVMAAWQDWAPGAPDAMSATLRIAARDDAEPGVELVGAMLGGESGTRALLGRLVASAGHDPVSAVHEHMPYREVKRRLAGEDPAEPPGLLLKSELFRRPLPREALDGLVRTLTADHPPGGSRELAFTPLGGAYARVPSGATAYAHRAERFLLEHTATVGENASAEAAQAWVTASWRTAHPWGSGRVYPNFPDPDLQDWAEAYHGGNHRRLEAVKRTYDPGNLFRFPQGLGG